MSSSLAVPRQQSYAQVDRQSVHVALFGSATLCLSVWELYYGGVRPLDIVALSMLSIGLVTPSFGPSVRLASLVRLSPFVVPVVVYSLIGVWGDTENAKAALGILLGVACFVLVGSWPISQQQVLRVTRVCLAVHLLLFWIQLISYRVAGTFVNYLAFAGLVPRAFSPFFRPTGLFMEPATFSLFCIMLVGLHYLYRRRLLRLDIFALVSACASLSLWGILASLMLFTWCYWRRWWFWLLCAGGSAVFLLDRRLAELVTALPVLSRLTSLGQDASAIQRYGGIGGLSRFDWAFSEWFGSGVSSINYYAFGENGWSYVLTAAGIIGTCGFFAWILFATPRSRGLFRMFLVGLCLTAGYLWTSFVWWWWLALLTKRYDSSFYSR